MTTQEIVTKLWSLCGVLRDDGITYHQYVTELTYLLFLKLAKETGAEDGLPEACRWDRLTEQRGDALKERYGRMLTQLGEGCTGRVREIYRGAASNIDEPKNLEAIIRAMDGLDWYSAREEGLGGLYEGLLEKNAGEKKAGAGQYFTPRVLIDMMVRLTDPQPGERCCDPACGTFGFMIAADRYIRQQAAGPLTPEAERFQKSQAFTGCELVRDTHRLALMNAMLHGLEGEILWGDTLSDLGRTMGDYDLVLTNPPFGTKKGGERAARGDLSFPTGNKQLDFLQHIYRSLKPNGRSRAAVVVPDNVLFQRGDGEGVRRELMDWCDLHTVLRLPTGIFYAQNVKTNVLFFTRGEGNRGNTGEVWFYDLRTDMPRFGKTAPLKREHFADFERAYLARDRRAVEDRRWSVLTREQIAARGNSLDFGLMAASPWPGEDGLPDPAESARACAADLTEAARLLLSVAGQLDGLEGS